MARQAVAVVLGALLLVAIAAGAQWGVSSRAPLPIDLHLALLGVAFLLYAAVLVLILRTELARPVMQWLMLAAILARLVTLAGPHRANGDVGRYLWDGHVLAHGYNPYAHAPADAALDPIRAPFLYQALNPDYNHIRTVYGPVAVTVFAVCTRLPGNPESNLRAAMTLADVATIILIVLLLRQCGLPESWSLVYALNPLLLDAFAQRGQVDALMLPLMVAAVLSLARKRPLLSGILLAAAVLVKAAALVCLPILFWADWSIHRRNEATRLAIGFAGTIILGCMPFVSAGLSAFDGLRVYASQWRANAALFPVLEALTGPTGARVLVTLCLVAALLWLVRGRRDFAGVSARLALLFAALLLLAPAVFPWYLTWPLPFVPFALARRPWRWFGAAILVWTATSLLWYARFLVYPPVDSPYLSALVPPLRAACARMPEPWRVIEYLPVLALALVGVWRVRRSRRFSACDTIIEDR